MAGCLKDVSARDMPCSLPPLPEAFHVDMDSGLVTTKRPLHSYERFNLTVVATDGGEPPLWGTTMLLVEVIDVNDNRPVFVRPPNGTIVHIKEVRVSQGLLPTSMPLPTPSPLHPTGMPASERGGPIVKVEKLRPEQGADLFCAAQGSAERWLAIWAVSAKGLGFKSKSIAYQPNYLEQVTSLSLFFPLQHGTDNL